MDIDSRVVEACEASLHGFTTKRTLSYGGSNSTPASGVIVALVVDDGKPLHGKTKDAATERTSNPPAIPRESAIGTLTRSISIRMTTPHHALR
jgi:hypothetical protein